MAVEMQVGSILKSREKYPEFFVVLAITPAWITLQPVECIARSRPVRMGYATERWFHPGEPSGAPFRKKNKGLERVRLASYAYAPSASVWDGQTVHFVDDNLG